MDDEVEGTAFRDLLTITLMAFVVIVIILIPFIARKTEAIKDSRTGNVVVEITWPEKMNTDVDLWVQAPGDKPVGYSSKNGLYFNLLRDDLGMRGDTTDLNYEFAATHGLVAGEYVANVHLYSNAENVYPVPVHLEITVNRENSPGTRIAERDVQLWQLGEELTVLRFILDERGGLVSQTDLFQPLRNAPVLPR